MAPIRGLSKYRYTRDTGSGAIAFTFAPDVNFVLIAINLHLDANGVGTYTADIDATAGVAHDVNLISQNMAGTTDFIRTYEGSGYPRERGDKVVFAFPNTGSAAFGLEIVYREEN